MALKTNKLESRSLELVDINSLEWSTNVAILTKVTEVKQQRPELFTGTKAKRIFVLCNEAGVVPQVTVKILKLNQRMTNAVLAVWSQANMCKPETDNNLAVLESYKLWQTFKSKFDVDAETLSNLEKVKTMDLSPAIAFLDAVPEKNSSDLYYGLMRDLHKSKARFELASLFVDKGFYPKNPSAVLLTKGLTTEQGYSIIKGLKGIKPYTDEWDWGLAFMVILNEQFELAYQLVNAGYLLVNPGEVTLHPLITMLDKLEHYHENEHFWLLLDTIVDDIGEILPYQLNHVYRLKLTKPALFKLLIDRYPQLFPNEPEFLVSVECD